LIKGNGRKFVGDQMVKFEFTAFNADTGDEFATSKYDGTDTVSQTFSPKQAIDFCKALSGATVGSRVAILIPAAMAHKNTADAKSGIKANDDIIFIMDLVDVLYPKALGEIASAQNGVPTVIRADNGQPSVQIPNQAPPTSTSLYTVIKSSDSQTIELGDKVVLKYSGFLWDGGSVFDSSWTATDANGIVGAPVEWELTADGFITGFVKALTQSRNGQAPHVGDQILAVIPPSEAYGAGGNASVPGNSTLVFVIDILGVTKAKK
jgi:peptidylprolyl isomerase